MLPWRGWSMAPRVPPGPLPEMVTSAFRAELGGPEAYANPAVAALFAGRGEGAAFLRALGTGGMAEMKSVVIWAGTEPVAAASLLWLPFDLVADAPRLQPAIYRLRKFRARTGYLRLCGLGGLHTGEPQIVISGRLDPAGRDAAFNALIDVAEAEAGRRRAHFHYMMNIGTADATWIGPLMRARGYFPMEGLPMPWQHLPFATIEDYFASRHSKSRLNLKKTLARAREAIAVSETSTVDADLEAELDRLALSMHEHARSKLGGVELFPPGFHRRMAELGQVRILLYRLAGRLVGFGYLIEEDEVCFGKTMGLSWPEATEYNLIHFNLFCSIEATIRRGGKWLVLGEGGYPTKLRFGAGLVRRTTYIKGRGIAGPLLPLASGRLDDFNPARQWPEVVDPANYYDADPARLPPPVKRIWTPNPEQAG